MQIGVGLGVRDYSAHSVEAAMTAFWACVETLVAEGATCIMLSGVPVSAGLGRQRILELIDEVPEKAGIPFDATLEAVVRSLNAFGARAIVMGSRFPAAANQAIGTYLEQAGIEVLATTSRDVSLSQARELSMADGMALALEVGREAARACPEAQAMLVPGGATLSLHAIPALEAEFGKPVVTNLSAEIWSALIRPGTIPPVAGWGKLLANELEA
jgi:maleate cis-trans isomerase